LLFLNEAMVSGPRLRPEHPIQVLRSGVVYAIIRDRGTQYRVEEGQVVELALLDADPGSQLELGEVLLVGGSDSVKVGTPLVEGAKVLAKVLDTTKGDKIIVFKYKNKKRYRRRTGHRQQYTRIAISQIVA
jgi:large subunit ribosomal protein L21